MQSGLDVLGVDFRETDFFITHFHVVLTQKTSIQTNLKMQTRLEQKCPKRSEDIQVIEKPVLTNDPEFATLCFVSP